MSSEMPVSPTLPTRFIGLDIHKHYLVAVAVDADLNRLFGPRRVGYADLETWIRKTLTPQDAVVIEMTTNTWQIYDELLPHVHSVTVVHPPHVALITRSQVMTDKIAALNLARLLAKGLLVSIWVPPQDVRDLRALIAQRRKMVSLSTQARNRLHAVLHSRHILPPEGNLFSAEKRDWWRGLSLPAAVQVQIENNLDTLQFAQKQIERIEAVLTELAAKDERVGLLAQLPGFGLLTILACLAAVGDITRFPTAKQLVGYSGLGARIHDSGQTTRSGRITKAGRKDLRAALVEAAQVAANTHPHWQAELARLEPRLGRNKAIVAIARKLLVAAWHVLSGEAPYRHSDPLRIARKLANFAFTLGQSNRQMTAGAYARQYLDRLGIGQDIHELPWGNKKHPLRLPPSALLTDPSA
jgi:transposase